MMFNVTSAVEDEMVQLTENVNINLQIEQLQSSYMFHSGESTVSYKITISNCHLPINSSTILSSCPVAMYVRSTRLSSQSHYDYMMNCSQAQQTEFCVLEVTSLEVNKWQYITMISEIDKVSFQFLLELNGECLCLEERIKNPIYLLTYFFISFKGIKLF